MRSAAIGIFRAKRLVVLVELLQRLGCVVEIGESDLAAAGLLDRADQGEHPHRLANTLDSVAHRAVRGGRDPPQAIGDFALPAVVLVDQVVDEQELVGEAVVLLVVLGDLEIELEVVDLADRGVKRQDSDLDVALAEILECGRAGVGVDQLPAARRDSGLTLALWRGDSPSGARNRGWRAEASGCPPEHPRSRGPRRRQPAIELFGLKLRPDSMAAWLKTTESSPILMTGIRSIPPRQGRGRSRGLPAGACRAL